MCKLTLLVIVFHNYSCYYSRLIVIRGFLERYKRITSVLDVNQLGLIRDHDFLAHLSGSVETKVILLMKLPMDDSIHWFPILIQQVVKCLFDKLSPIFRN